MQATILKTGILTYGILAILSLVFYLERTIFLDISFHLFYILKDSGFTIQNYRFGAIMTQLFPLICSKMGVGLESTMKVYSLGFVLYYFFIFIACIQISRSIKFGIGMLLFSTLFVTNTFYWIQSELPQGLALLILFFAFLWRIRSGVLFSNWWTVLVFMAFIITLVFFHPLILIPFVFLVLFFYFEGTISKQLLISSFVSFLFIYIIKSVFFNTTYDSTSMSGIRNFIELFPNYLNLKSNQDFVFYLFKDYYLLLVAFILVLIFYIVEKNFKKLFLIVSFCFGYLLLVNVSYPDGTNQFYIENLYLPLSIFVIFPLTFDLQKLLSNKSTIIILVIILTIRLLDIGLSHRPYSDRVDYLKEIMRKTNSMDQKKLILHEDNFNMDTILITWATPYEFWLLSTITTGETRSIMITSNPNEISWAKDYKNKFLTEWGDFNYEELPEFYFKLKDTTSYNLLNELQ